MSSANAASRTLSLSYYTVPELSAPAAVEVAARTGCAHVGLRLLAGQPDVDLLPAMTDAGVRREIKDALAATGVSILDANTARLVPGSRVSMFEPFLDIAAELGAHHVLATGDDPQRERLAANLRELCELAASRRLTVEFEFVPWMTVPDIAGAARLLGEVGHPALGIAVDALHVSRSASRLSDLTAIPPDRFRYLHLCDASAQLPLGRDALLAEAVGERLFPGEGSLDLVGLLRALPDHIPLALEVPTRTLALTMPAPERVRRAVEGARRVLARAFPD